MRATQAERERLNNELHNIVEQMKALDAAKVILFGLLARQQISLFSDIDLLVLNRPFFRHILAESKVLYERHQKRS